MILLVGLGNPGEKYTNTRHNAGSILVEKWAKENGGEFSFNKKFNAAESKTTFQDTEVLCLLPETFMNNSGDAVQATASFYKISPENIWIVLDDLNLDTGMVRTRQAGSAGGHNGLESVIQKMGKDTLPRIRIGIGLNEGVPSETYVLQPFSNEEIENLATETYKKFTKILESAIEKGFPNDTLA
ncbi:MAG: aminoacyl-tRNA hydrolase [Candidatus Jacksonbacteria bacterium]|jgi:peptidyl-tRNA hydrolase, PTH1 family|nr:aminoacyl-tRNA hydrolase [Candidatus Jacksonbacteria bacterium]MBT6955579.1 aminoacyl-tRNA hydrolase [Candidatus Jacksonbacteria bacterium]